LHRHHIGALSIMPGIDAHELGEALRALSAEPEREGPVGLKPDVVNWPHICCRLLASSRRHRGRQPSPLPTTTLELTLGEEAEAFRWLQHEVQSGGSVPLLEAEAVVRSLSLAMHGDSRMVLPLLKLKEFDQYTTTHSLNVAVLAMGLAESLGCRPREIRAIGIAGLQHDIGKIRIPLEVLTKPGKLTDDERAIMNTHPVDGARVIMQSDEDLGMAATVAYEHHIMLNGGGYPPLHYTRECAMASRLVHVCDVYDALSTTRPYRDAWPSDRTMLYLEDRAGTEFDPELVNAFSRTLRQGQAQVRVLSDEPQQT
jgi:putative nucleotidyltransferase with HDIG domain